MKKITRRQFLTSAGATSAALLLSSLPHAAAADENCLRKVTPAATNSNDLSWDMAEEILTHISDPVFPAYTVNVLAYGAVPNDGKLDTAAIQRAIDETSAHGGGTVVIGMSERSSRQAITQLAMELFIREGADRVRGVAAGGGHNRVDGALFDALPNLQVISSFGVGYDHIDAEAAKASGTQRLLGAGGIGWRFSGK